MLTACWRRLAHSVRHTATRVLKLSLINAQILSFEQSARMQTSGGTILCDCALMGRLVLDSMVRPTAPRQMLLPAGDAPPLAELLQQPADFWVGASMEFGPETDARLDVGAGVLLHESVRQNSTDQIHAEPLALLGPLSSNAEAQPNWLGAPQARPHC